MEVNVLYIKPVVLQVWDMIHWEEFANNLDIFHGEPPSRQN